MTFEFEPYNEDEFRDFLDSLPDLAAAKVLALLKKIQQQGLYESMKMKWVKKLEDNLYEVRCEAAGHFPRALFFQFVEEKDSYNGSKYIITNVFSKKKNKTPETEKKKARNRRRLYQNT